MEYTGKVRFIIIINGEQFFVSLNGEELDGIIGAWEDLDHKVLLQIYFPTGHILHPAFEESSKWRDANLVDKRGQNLNFSRDTFLCPDKTWLECVRSTLYFPRTPIKRFTFIFLENPIYGLIQSHIIVNQETPFNQYFLRHSDTLDYIQGYIQLLNWLNIPWQDHIKLIHDGNVPLTL